MRAKYYTPIIEEFHVGFEYEYQQYDNKWIFQIFNRSNLDNEFDSYCKFRVKYLDKEDIESLGFKYKQGDETSYIKSNISIHIYDKNKWNTKENMINIFKKDKLRAVGKTLLFSGIIKNKSELKKLLKQLNIDGV